MADNGQGTMGGGGAGGSASVSAAAASVSTPLVRYNPPQDIELLLRDVYDFQQQPDKVAFAEGTRLGQISNESSALDSRYSSRNHWQAFVTFRIMVRVEGEEFYESRDVTRSAAAAWRCLDDNAQEVAGKAARSGVAEWHVKRIGRGVRKDDVDLFSYNENNAVEPGRTPSPRRQVLRARSFSPNEKRWRVEHDYQDYEPRPKRRVTSETAEAVMSSLNEAARSRALLKNFCKAHLFTMHPQ